MPDLTLICETCRFPISGDTGCIYATFADINAARARERHKPERGEVLNVAEFDIIGHLLEPGPVRWRTSHYAHFTPDSPAAYEIGSGRITTWRHLIWWTAHLMEKNWFPLSDWDALLREVGDDGNGDGPRRIRAAVREAA